MLKKKCFQVTTLSNPTSTALLLLRVVAGAAFLIHGWPKIQAPFQWMGAEAPVPGFLQLLAAISEFVGGGAWILGLLTPLFSFGIACTMAVAVYFHAGIKGDPFVGHQGSYELALVYFSIAILLLCGGPGKFSADRKIFGAK